MDVEPNKFTAKIFLLPAVGTQTLAININVGVKTAFCPVLPNFRKSAELLIYPGLFPLPFW